MRINEPESPGSRPVVLVILLAVAVVLLTVWYREGDTGPLHRTKIAVQTVASPLSTGGEFVTRPVRNLFAWAADLGVSRSQLEQLRAQNARLRTRVAELEEARLENDRLRELVKLAQAADLETIAARVIGRATNSWEGFITIDRGSSDGVESGMPVIGPQGLLGQTVQVAGGSSRVRLITDQRSGVAAMVQDSRAVGIVHGTLDAGLRMDFVSRESSVTVGDTIVTSGLGGVYPKALVIGEVTRVENDPSALYLEIDVAPTSGVGKLEEVLVVLTRPQAAVLEGGE
jgi:rod shape-determining protein MreC